MLLKINDIIVDQSLNSRVEGLDLVTVAEYAANMGAGDKFPPIDVFSEDNKTYLVASGFHRLAAAKQAQLTEIEATIHPGGYREAKLFSFGTNAEHGLRRSNADKRKSVSEMLMDEEWQKWSDREIARRCRVHHSFVAKIRTEILTGYIASETERLYVTKHGTVSTMQTANIGKGNADDEDIETEQEQVYQPGQYAYCKYCYTKHYQWRRGLGYDGTVWECERCDHATADECMRDVSDEIEEEDGVSSVEPQVAQVSESRFIGVSGSRFIGVSESRFIGDGNKDDDGMEVPFNKDKPPESKTKQDYSKFATPPWSEAEKEKIRRNNERVVSRMVRLAGIVKYMERIPDTLITFIYRDMAKLYHPDKQHGENPEIARQRAEAFALIADIRQILEVDDAEYRKLAKSKGIIEG